MQIFRIWLIFFDFLKGWKCLKNTIKQFQEVSKIWDSLRSNPKNIYLHKRHLTFFFWNILNFQRFEFLIFFFKLTGFLKKISQKDAFLLAENSNCCLLRNLPKLFYDRRNGLFEALRSSINQRHDRKMEYDRNTRGEIGKNAGGCSAWIFSRNKEEDDDKAKVGKRSRFLAHLTIINAWLAFSLDEPKPNHHSMEHAHAQKNSRPTIWYHTTTKNYLGSQKYFSSYFGYETKNSPQK